MTSRHLIHMGKLLCKNHPDIAAELSQQIQADTPLMSDLSELPSILETFCAFNEITLSEIIGSELKGSKKTVYKHIFIAVVVKIYSPATFSPTKSILVNNLRSSLSQLLKTRSDRISRLVSNIRSHIKVYKDFAQEVNKNYSIIINEHATKTSNERTD